ncbi:MAG: hypothetical protein GXX93_07110 [Anaerolineae bacterium]|nr:hypothetical protein [Anaerolineae bacterium]
MPGPDDRTEQLHESIRQIVVTRERTPRSPNWAAAWRRTLLRYVDQLNRPGAAGARAPVQPEDRDEE